MFTSVVRTPILMLQMVAIYDIPFKHMFGKRLFRIYQVLFHAFFVYIPNILLLAYLTTVDNFEAFSENASFTGSFVNIFVRAFFIRRNGKKLRSFINNMNSITPNGYVEYSFYSSAKQISRRLIISVNLWMFLGVIGTAGLTLLSENKTLPFLFWYPIQLKNMFDNQIIFETIYLHQVGISIFCSVIVSAADTFLFSSLVFHKYQIQVLGHRLSQCGIRNTADRNHNKQLIDCIKMHVDIKKLNRTFHEIFSWLFLCQISQSVFTLGVTIVSLTSSNMPTSVFIGKIVYLGIVFAQNALYCYLGNTVLTESTEISTQAYFSDFLKFNLATRKNFLFVIHLTTSRPMKITANGWCTFSLPLLLYIIKTTYNFTYALIMLEKN